MARELGIARTTVKQYRRGSLPLAERACAEVLALPIHPALTPAAQSYVVDQIAAFYRN